MCRYDGAMHAAVTAYAVYAEIRRLDVEEARRCRPDQRRRKCITAHVSEPARQLTDGRGRRRTPGGT